MLVEIFSWLSSFDTPVYLVGGSLRQVFLGQKIHDYDFVSALSAVSLARRIAEKFDLPWFILDTERDMARVILKETALDFATLQQTLESDLSQRDLTINAMAYPVNTVILSSDWRVEHEQLIDPSGGFHDLMQGKIRALSPQNFQDDPLRLLRAFRFACVLNFEIEVETLKWLSELAPLIVNVPWERIHHELYLIFNISDSAKLFDYAAFQLLILNLLAGTEAQMPKKIAAYQCFEGLVKQLEQPVLDYLHVCIGGERNRLFLLKLAFLSLYPTVNSVEILSFQHWQLSRLEQESLRLWKEAVENFSLHPPTTPVEQFRFLQEVQADIMAIFMLFKSWQQCSENDVLILFSMMQEWLSPDSKIAHPAALINGHDVLAILNKKAGPLIGQLLQAVAEAQVLGTVQNREQALVLVQSLASDNSK